MVSTVPTRHRHHRKHETPPDISTRWRTFRSQIRSQRFVISGCAFVLIALMAFSMLACISLQHTGAMRYGYPYWFVLLYLGVLGGSTALSGVVLLRRQYHGRLPAVLSVAFLLSCIGLFGGQVLYGMLAHQMTYSLLGVASSISDAHSHHHLVHWAVASESILPTFLLIMMLYIALAIVLVISVRKLLKGDRRSHRRRRHHSRHRMLTLESEA